jgi:hypothetical protein
MAVSLGLSSWRRPRNIAPPQHGSAVLFVARFLCPSPLRSLTLAAAQEQRKFNYNCPLPPARCRSRVGALAAISGRVLPSAS